MASVVKCGRKWKVYWCVTVNGVRHRSSRTFDTKQAACGFVGSGIKTAHLKNPIYIYNLNDPFVNVYFQKFSKNTKNFYIYVLNRFFSDVNKPVSSVTGHDIKEWVSRQTTKARSVNAKLTAIFSYFAWASAEYGFEDPTANLTMLREDRPVRHLITVSEFHHILSCGSESFRQRALFLANTGLRASEFCNLQWKACVSTDENYGWIDEGKRLIHVIGKGRKHRLVPINQTAHSILQELRKQAVPQVDFVFKTKGRRLTRYALYQQFQGVSEHSCVSCSPHSLRHLFCTMLLSQGLSAPIVAKIMGHSSTRITEDIYGHLDSSIFKIPEVV